MFYLQSKPFNVLPKPYILKRSDRKQTKKNTKLPISEK